MAVEETLSAQEPGSLSSDSSVEPEAKMEKMELTIEGLEESFVRDTVTQFILTRNGHRGGFH